MSYITYRYSESTAKAVTTPRYDIFKFTEPELSQLIL